MEDATQAKGISTVAFLGVVERANIERETVPHLMKHNILGLKTYFPAMIYPVSFAQVPYALAIHRSVINKHVDIEILSPSGRVVRDIAFKMERILSPTKEPLVDQIGTKERAILSGPDNDWQFVIIPPSTKSGGLIDEAGRHTLVFLVDKHVVGRAELDFLIVNPPPLDASRIAAIRSNVHATKAVRHDITCTLCGSVQRTYAALEMSEKLELDGFTWYERIPDRFVCRCGKVDLSLEAMKKNLHGLLGAPLTENTSINPIGLYETSTVRSLYQSFKALVEAKPREEDLQAFITDNPLILNQFNALRIFPKAPILTKFKTDFAILTASRELVLVEIEKVTTKLLKSKGGTHSELQHAIDQTRDWVHELSTNRLACLDCIGLAPDEVAGVSRVVIAGRDHGYDRKHLQRLKGGVQADIRIITYDDLIAGLSALADKIARV